MKPWIPVVLCAALVACQKTPSSEVAVSPAPDTPAPTPVAVVASTPEPVIPVTPAPELAPPGVFYLLAAARVETDSGITGLPPGTGVKLVRPGVYLTPAGEAPLNDAILTNDMGRARQALAADRAAQTALQARGAAANARANAAAASADSQQSANHNNAIAAMNAADRAAAISALEQQKAELQSTLKSLREQNAKESYDHHVRGRGILSTASTDIPKAEAALEQVTAQLHALQSAH